MRHPRCVRGFANRCLNIRYGLAHDLEDQDLASILNACEAINESVIVEFPNFDNSEAEYGLESRFHGRIDKRY